MKTQATNRPWIVHQSGLTVDTALESGELSSICQGYVNNKNNRENFELIVRAVNCHDLMLEALERAAAIFENRLEYVDTMKPIYDAIKRAKGEL